MVVARVRMPSQTLGDQIVRLTPDGQRIDEESAAESTSDHFSVRTERLDLGSRCPITSWEGNIDRTCSGRPEGEHPTVVLHDVTDVFLGEVVAAQVEGEVPGLAEPLGVRPVGSEQQPVHPQHVLQHPHVVLVEGGHPDVLPEGLDRVGSE